MISVWGTGTDHVDLAACARRGITVANTLGVNAHAVAELARAFGMTLLVTTAGTDRGRATALGARHVPLQELLTQSDVVSLHLRLTDATRAILGRAQFALLKPTAYLVNTARGALIDRDALLDALEHERIAGAALDVFDEEPLPAENALRLLPNVVLTPHNAGVTPEVIAEGLRRAVENVQRYLGVSELSER